MANDPTSCLGARSMLIGGYTGAARSCQIYIVPLRCLGKAGARVFPASDTHPQTKQAVRGRLESPRRLEAAGGLSGNVIPRVVSSVPCLKRGLLVLDTSWATLRAHKCLHLSTIR